MILVAGMTMVLKLALPTIALASIVTWCEWSRSNSINRPLTYEELEAHLQSEFSLGELRLTHLADGRYEGTGTSTSGQRYQFDISQSRASRITTVTRENGGDSIPARFFDPARLTHSTDFTDNSLLYLVLVFGYILWVGKVIRKQGASEASAAAVSVRP